MDPIKIVAEFMVEGQSNANIIEYLQSKEMSLEDAALVFEQALANFVKSANLPRSVRRGWCLESLRDLYQKLVSTGDYVGALRAIQEIAKLADLYKSDSQKNLKDEINEYIDAVMTLA
jgi:hypothetical protein